MGRGVCVVGRHSDECMNDGHERMNESIKQEQTSEHNDRPPIHALVA